MVFISIDDAPFSDEEKRQIKEMGFKGADWGHPERILQDPVAYFRERVEYRKQYIDKDEGAGLTRYEKNEDPPPFEPR